MKHTLAFFGLLFILFSCKKEDIVNGNIQGDWQVDEVETTIQTAGTDKSTTSNDLSGQGILFSFKEDGSYSTNANINLNGLSKGSDQTGTYVKTNNTLEITYTIPDFNLDVNFTIAINSVTANYLQLEINQQALVNAFTGSLDTLSPTNRLLAQAFLNNLVDFKLLIDLSR